MPLFDLTIDDLGAQGDGIAHKDGETIFVAGALAGEKVRVELGNTPHGKILEVLESSPDRAAPACPHFLKCGGCRLQHLQAKTYSAFKLKQLESILTRQDLSLPPFEPIIITPPQTRRRARLAAQRTKKGVTLGFNEAQSHTLVDIEHCAVLSPVLMALIPKIRKHLSLWLPNNQSCDIQITLLENGIDLVLIGGPKLSLFVREKLGHLAQALGVENISWRQDDKKPLEPIAQMVPLQVTFGKTTLDFPPASFLQATPAGEKALIDFVMRHSKKGLRVLDLFCGLGTFGLSLEKPKYVHFSDIDGPAIDALHKMLKSNKRMETEQRNLMREPFSASECNDFDLVIFDPPRIGAKAQAEQLARSDVKNIIAISCDPSSFARDAKTLIAGGYELKALQPVDQFLFSPHLELAAYFEKK